ncbi:MAG: hypothetical protein Kow0019_15730 [Methanobacteriaceae archaeon]
MKSIRHYNIHNLIKFQIVRDKYNDRFKDLNLPFSFFEVDNTTNPDIILNIGPFNPSNDECYLIDHKYYIKENYFYCKDSGGLANWEVEIKCFEKGNTIINYNGFISGPESFLYPDLLPQDIFLRPILEYKLNKKGYYLVHCAGISNNNSGYLFTGRGSSYKSSLAMDLVRKYNYDLLGDDKVIVGENLDLFSFPVHLKAFEFKVSNMQDENFRSSGKLQLKSIINFYKFLKNLKVNKDYKKNKISIIQSSKLKSLFFVNKTNYLNKVQVSENPSLSKKLCLNNLSEIVKGHTFMFFDYGQYFYKYVIAYSFIYPENSLKKHWHKSNMELGKFLGNTPIYEIFINKDYNDSILNKVQDFIKEQE